MSWLSSSSHFHHPLFSAHGHPERSCSSLLPGSFIIWELPACKLQLDGFWREDTTPCLLLGTRLGSFTLGPSVSSVSANANPSTISKRSYCLSPRAQHFPEASQLFLYVAGLSNSTNPRANIINPPLKRKELDYLVPGTPSPLQPYMEPNKSKR